MVEGTDLRGSKMSYENLLMLYHQRMGHISYGVLIRVYPHLFEKAMVILTLRAIVILIGLVVLMIGNPHQDTCLLGAIWSLG